MHCVHPTKSEMCSFINLFDTILLDCDGVLWHENTAIEGAVDAVKHLVELGKRVFLVTNNSTGTRDQCLEKCINLNFPIYSKEEIVTTPYLVAEYVKRNVAQKSRIYLIGCESIATSLTDAGYDHFGSGPDTYDSYTNNSGSVQLGDLPIEENVGAVVFGFDPHFSYPKLMKAGFYLLDDDCQFIVSDMDEADFVGIHPAPGTGALLKSLLAITTRTPVIMGKPFSFMLEHLENKFGINKQTTLMVGDRCDADIKFGRDNGIKTLFVKTGASTIEDIDVFIEQQRYDLVPDFIIDKLGDIV